MNQLVASFPYFGGKRRIAAEVWARMGDVANYVEPFFGSGAVLLGRPSSPKIETVNDVDHFITNFWRAVQAAPEVVAHHADWPVNETDLQSRHYWLLTEGRDRIKRCGGDPRHHDSEVAGYWLWGACAWIGGGWCSGDGPWSWSGDEWRQLPHLSGGGEGIKRKLPHLGDGGRGINRKLPHLGSGRDDYILQWMQRLAARLRDVRVCCGDWSRVCGDSVTRINGVTGVFLDPPYSVEDRASVYNNESFDISRAVREWALDAGSRPDMRIAICGYDGEHNLPPDWSHYTWKAHGGYGNQSDGQGRANAAREVIWFSPACIQPEQSGLFDTSRLNEAYDRRTMDVFGGDSA